LYQIFLNGVFSDSVEFEITYPSRILRDPFCAARIVLNALANDENLQGTTTFNFDRGLE
jgi:hypothetical protein